MICISHCSIHIRFARLLCDLQLADTVVGLDAAAKNWEWLYLALTWLNHPSHICLVSTMIPPRAPLCTQKHYHSQMICISHCSIHIRFARLLCDLQLECRITFSLSNTTTFCRINPIKHMLESKLPVMPWLLLDTPPPLHEQSAPPCSHLWGDKVSTMMGVA